MSNEKPILNEKQRKIYDDTKAWIESLPPNILNLVEDYDHVMMGNKTVVCTAILRTGFEITAYSAPMNIHDFNLELGRTLAKRKVLEELMNMERYYEFNMNNSARINVVRPVIIENGMTYDYVGESEIE